VLEERFAAMLDAPSRAEMYRRMEFFDAARFEPFQQADMRFFLEKLLHARSLRVRVVASTVLAGYVGRPLTMDVADDASPAEVAQVADNWLLHFRYRRDRYQPGFWRKSWYILADTQYAHLVVRLATFHFGRSALRTREPVAGRIWNAVLVSAPIMLLSEALIYLVAVPLGILCAVGRGRWIDRAISLALFLLYSIPAFVAGMLFLVFFCYGDYLRIFPMTGLHAEAAVGYDFPRYALDYLWHIVLPVVCLALFSLAGMAMYARSSLLDVLGQDYIRTARAKGLAESKVILKHALRNSMIPVITLFASFPAGDARRQRAGGVDLRHPGDGLLELAVDPPERHPHADGHDLPRRDRRAGEPAVDRPLVRAGRSADQLRRRAPVTLQIEIETAGNGCERPAPLECGDLSPLSIRTDAARRPKAATSRRTPKARVVEVVLLFPAFFLILILVAMIGPSIYIIMVVIGLTGWPTIARLIRGEVLKERVIDYVAAARALGASHARIIFRHVLPNALAPALVAVPFGIADAIVTEAGLGLLGFSVRPPAPSWGNLLNVANSNYHYWWLVVAPSLAIFVTVTVFNLVGNALRDAMDPRLRQ
jgi:ABC-type dipeptide/oligopeptide/nickel transport system permease subunit